MKNILAFLAGSVFAIGLMLSGMANPAKVLGFLDLFGQWDASLAFVMLGAISIAFVPFQYAVKQQQPTTLLNEPIELPQTTQIDTKLILGAVLFGMGWGIAGMCPAPALTLLGLGHFSALYFIIAMLLAMWLYQKIAEKM